MTSTLGPDRKHEQDIKAEIEHVDQLDVRTSVDAVGDENEQASVGVAVYLAMGVSTSGPDVNSIHARRGPADPSVGL